MQNFTEEIKNEITDFPVSERAVALSMLSAFIRTSGSIISRGDNFGFEIKTENERTAEFFCDLMENFFNITLTVSGAKFDLLSGKDKFSFECVNEKSNMLLKELKILDEDTEGVVLNFLIDGSLISKDKLKKAFLKGAFLGGGSCTLPEENRYSRTGYHFEIVFSNKTTADSFCEFLFEFDILAKLVTRKGQTVVYVKSKEVISDILNFMSCEKSLARLNEIVEHKDKQNNANRVNNCSVSNIDKTVMASVKQVQAIEVISQTIGLQSLDKMLFDVAESRLADKNASMQELAKRLNISKSCINHRMRKLLELAEELN